MPSRLKIVRGPADKKTGRRNSALVIDGQHLWATPTELKILRLLYENVGQVVPYERFGTTLRQKTNTMKRRNTLRQHVSSLNKMLADNRPAYVIAVMPRAGYAMCKLLSKGS
jgi:DNA-binding winged helix-turn-helix (wHTH) protein